MMQPPDTVTFKQDLQVTLPAGKILMISQADWARIRGNVERWGEPPVEWASTWAAAALGAAIALFGTAIALHTTKNNPQTALRTGLWVAVAFCVVFAICFGAQGRRERKGHLVGASVVCDDMDGVSEAAGCPTLGALPPPPPRIGILVRVRDWLLANEKS